MSTVYIKDENGECIATIFAEDGAVITAEEFLQALSDDVKAANAYLDSDYKKRILFPLTINDTFSLFVKMC
jgi:hypothetical protein